MAFSGTISQTTFNTRRVIDSAMRRCKIVAQTITSEHLDIAKDQLYLFLSDLANQGVPLWAITKTLYPVYEGVNQIVTYEGTVDILNCNFRTLAELTGTNTDTSTSRKVAFSSATAVASAGILWSAAAVPIALQRSDDGTTWTTIQSEDPTAAAGEWTWFDLGSVVEALYFRVLALSGTLSFDQIYLGNAPYEVQISRMNRDDYINLPNKIYQSNRVLNYWLDRQALSPVLNIWPAPNAQATTAQVVVWAHRHIMDVGTLAQELEVPQRWYEAVVAGLASKLAVEVAEVDPQMIPILDSRAADALYKAQAEERDNSPFNLMPAIGAYTR